MGFDGLIFRRITNILQQEYQGAKINKLGALSSNDYLFELYQKGHHNYFFVSFNPSAPYFTITTNQHYTFMSNNHFTNLLKTHLEGGFIQQISQQNNDRILLIEVAKKDEIGDLVTKYLIIEFLGKMTNMILCKADFKIIDALHRLSLSDITNRTLYAGATYRLPPFRVLSDPLTATCDQSKTYASQYFGISPLIEKEWTSQNFTSEDVHHFVQELLTSSSLYIGRINGKLDYHLLPLKSFVGDCTVLPWNEGLTSFYHNAWKAKQKEEKSNELTSFTKKELIKLQRKLYNLDQDLTKAMQAASYKLYGDLLLTYGEHNQTGLASLAIHDDNTNLDYTIPLDAKLNILKNAARYFEKYHKAKNALVMVKEQLEICQQQIEYFELLKIQIEEADEMSLLEIKKELVEQGYLANKIEKHRAKKMVKKSYNTLHFISPTGLEIYVGRNNVQNDYLTFSLARYNDYFFHVKDFPGAHVIVKGQTLDEPTIRLAANLAAYYSKARYSSSVPVDYTLVKNIKKPKGYKFGQVLMTNYKTIFIDPEKI